MVLFCISFIFPQKLCGREEEKSKKNCSTTTGYMLYVSRLKIGAKIIICGFRASFTNITPLRLRNSTDDSMVFFHYKSKIKRIFPTFIHFVCFCSSRYDFRLTGWRALILHFFHCTELQKQNEENFYWKDAVFSSTFILSFFSIVAV